ncbi:hypothetical protein [Blastopirellula marina]|uniref:SLA1 homology domain-containing protein n=1 Tax=Blastopirellula marina TaxID=124 RepID=A0A2S8GCV5_9BACT|nr:hypothetical protein [Blastopirellula marina]PQO41904.1 hypothetical protein C5Y98_02380 [Blastopirellula marina]PTL46262.1 hypothetical protein C5Y97_02380 [Blastopirellula marina]
MSNYRRSNFTVGMLAILATGLLVTSLPAQGALPYRYPISQPSHSWQGKGGSLAFSGRAIQRSGDFILFKTSKNLEITLPLKYLSQNDQDYLDHLAGNGPAPTETPIDTRPVPAGMTPVERPVEEPDDRVPPDDFFGPAPAGETLPEENPFGSMPADSAGGDPEHIYEQGAQVEVRDGGTWFAGKIVAVRPSNNTYFVSYAKSGTPSSRWLPATELRLPGGAEAPTTSEPMPEATPTSTTTTTKEVTVNSQSPVGYLVGPMKKGDKLTLSYISGKWKAWGRLASESPDSVEIGGGEKCRLAISEIQSDHQISKLTLVPAETNTRPFTWTAQQDHTNILLQINDNDGDFSGNPASDVKYSLTIEKSR